MKTPQLLAGVGSGLQTTHHDPCPVGSRRRLTSLDSPADMGSAGRMPGRAYTMPTLPTYPLWNTHTPMAAYPRGRSRSHEPTWYIQPTGWRGSLGLEKGGRAGFRNGPLPATTGVRGEWPYA